MEEWKNKSSFLPIFIPSHWNHSQDYARKEILISEIKNVKLVGQSFTEPQ